jgi:hypothetical protein
MASLPTILNASGLSRVTLKTTVSCNVGDLIGFDGTDWVLADADGRVAAEFMAMESVAAGSSVAVCQAGVLYDVDAPYTAGATSYLSATAGAHTATLPSASATLTILQRIGKALTTDTLAFNLQRHGPLQLRAQATYDPASLAATTARSDTVTVTGLLTSDVIRGVPEAVITGTGWNSGLLIQGLDVSAADTLRIRLQNASAGALDGASATVELIAERW